MRQIEQGGWDLKIVDLRSDTVTTPTDEMREAMYQAEVGDDARGDDPTVRRLEEICAQKMGKQAGLYVPSGTMGNQVAINVHTEPGDEAIVEEHAHCYLFELGGMAALSGVQAKPIPGERGALSPEAVEAAIQPGREVSPRTTLVCLENTHNHAGGTVITPEQTAAVVEVARKHGLKVHLDGARIFNAAVALGVDSKELTAGTDSVMMCLSKGLCAPVGSVLTGSAEFIERARRVRRMFGGGMRQAGIIAAAGIVAVEKMVDRLAEDHANARFLAEALAEIPKIEIDLESVQTNMVMVGTSQLGRDPQWFLGRLEERGVLAIPFGPQRIRLVTHKDVDRQGIEQAIAAVKEVAASA